MALGGTKLFCPSCKEVKVCAAIQFYKLHEPRHRRWYNQKHTDIQWFRRARQCLHCKSTFLTAEIEEKLITELIELRERLARRQRQDVAQLKKRTTWIARTEVIPLHIAREFIEHSAWWLTHSSGSPVRAPGHAKNIYKSHHGWSIDFGANTFLVGAAIERCRDEVNRYCDLLALGQIPLLVDLKRTLKQHISGAVANSNGYEYEGYYPVSLGQMTFGAQAIDVDDGANYIIEVTGISDLLAK